MNTDKELRKEYAKAFTLIQKFKVGKVKYQLGVRNFRQLSVELLEQKENDPHPFIVLEIYKYNAIEVETLECNFETSCIPFHIIIETLKLAKEVFGEDATI
jgi:predicted oxidoreductase